MDTEIEIKFDGPRPKKEYTLDKSIFKHFLGIYDNPRTDLTNRICEAELVYRRDYRCKKFLEDLEKVCIDNHLMHFIPDNFFEDLREQKILQITFNMY